MKTAIFERNIRYGIFPGYPVLVDTFVTETVEVETDTLKEAWRTLPEPAAGYYCSLSTVIFLGWKARRSGAGGES